jgi:hypothetical protein
MCTPIHVFTCLVCDFVCIPRCNSYRGGSPLETLPPPPPGDPNGGVIYVRIVLSPEEASRLCLCLWKRVSSKSNNVVVFPFAFHISVQQPFRLLWSRLLLHDHEPSRASFALCFKSLLMSLLPASEEFLLDFPSPRHHSSSGSYPLDLSGFGDPTGSNATAGLALRVTETHKPLYHGKVETPTKGMRFCLYIIGRCVYSIYLLA